MIKLPKINKLIRITKSLATLELIINPEWQYRYYSFNAKWSSEEEMASMRDGCGDEWFLLFHNTGWAGLKGFAHESPAANIEGLGTDLQDAVPERFKSFTEEPAFGWNSTTFCYWCENDESNWKSPDIIKGSHTGVDELLEIIVSGPQGYHLFAQDYYEREIDLKFVEQVFQHRTIDDKMVFALNSEISLADIQEEIVEIGYPK